MIPNCSGDHAARPHDPPHFRDRLMGVGDKMKDQQSKGGVEPAVLEGKGRKRRPDGS